MTERFTSTNEFSQSFEKLKLEWLSTQFKRYNREQYGLWQPTWT